MTECQCSLRIRLVGDGCRYCQPQEYIKRMEDNAKDDHAEIDALTARLAHYEKRSLPEYEAVMIGCEENDPIERLRFFCSIAMNGEDWRDVEPFFDDLTARVVELESEVLEQCRVNGFGSEREVRLMARVEALEAERRNINKVERHSDFQVNLTFTSCRAAGAFAASLRHKDE